MVSRKLMMATITCSHQKRKQSPQVNNPICPHVKDSFSLSRFPVGLTWMAQTGAFRSTQKINSLSHKHTTAQTLSNLDIIIHIKSTLKWTKAAEFSCLPANLSILDGPAVPLAVNTSKQKKMCEFSDSFICQCSCFTNAGPVLKSTEGHQKQT